MIARRTAITDTEVEQFDQGNVGIVATCDPADLVADPLDDELAQALRNLDVIIFYSEPGTLTAELVRRCDIHGVKLVIVASNDRDLRTARSLGAARPLPADAAAAQIVAAVHERPLTDARADSRARDQRGSVVVIWGTHGAPGRSTIAAGLASQIARSGRRVLLIDADTTAPSLALSLGLGDEGPGFAAACRQVERDALDERELSRLAIPWGSAAHTIDILTGLNRVSRWPELTESRVRAALEVARGWVDVVVVDVGAGIESDEEIMSDIDVPRRHAATRAALGSADRIVAVASADPLGVARFVRAYPDLRTLVGDVRVTVVANRVRVGPLGVDARGQIRRTLDRFVGVTDISFVPDDARAVDAASLAALTVDEAAPRSRMAAALRTVAASVAPGDGATGERRERRRRGVIGGAIALARRGGVRAAN